MIGVKTGQSHPAIQLHHVEHHLHSVDCFLTSAILIYVRIAFTGTTGCETLKKLAYARKKGLRYYCSP